MPEKTKWNVSEEEDNRTTLPANDCRRINGGQVASKEEQSCWSHLSEKTSPSKTTKPTIIVIDRLR